MLQVAAQTGCVAVGVEIRSELTSIGQALLKNYQTLVRAILLSLGKLVRTLRSHMRPLSQVAKSPPLARRSATRVWGHSKPRGGPQVRGPTPFLCAALSLARSCSNDDLLL